MKLTLKSVLAGSVTLVVPALAPVHAQEMTATETVLTEIVVTASRREQSLQDVGISVTALGAEDLASLGVKQTTDIVMQVPALKFNAFNPAVTVFNIRGVSQNNYSEHLEPPVAMYIDDAYVATTGGAGVPSFDIERVEVLRGPQGTLFGRNATGGLIHFISKRPTKHFEGYVDVMGGTEGHSSAEAALSGPLSDMAQFRLSGVYNYREAYIENLTGRDGGNQDNYALRAQLALQPTDDIDLLFIARHSRNKDENFLFSNVNAFPNADGLGRAIGPNENPWGSCNGCDPLGYRPGGDPYVISVDGKGDFSREVNGFQGRLEWDLGAVTLYSITDYQKIRKTYFSDDDGTPNPVFKGTYTPEYYQFSEELRLSAEADRFRWTGGLYYLEWKSRTSVVGVSEALYGAPGTPYIVGYDTSLPTETWSVFAQAEYDLTSQLTLIAGLRYVEDKKSIRHHPHDNFGFDLQFNPTTYPDLARQKFEDYAVRLQLNYRVTPDVLLYASFNRGIKGPSFSTPGFPPINVNELPHDGETLLAYEAGIKATMADDRVRLNVGGFYYDYEDYQAFFYLQLANLIRNLPAKANGVEAELTVLPVEGLTLSAGVSYMDSEVEGVGLPSGRFITTDLPQTPEISGNLLARYEVPVANTLKAGLQFDMTYTDSFNFQLVPSPVTQEPSYSVGNLSVSLANIDDRWSVALFCRNFWDETYRDYAVDFGGLWGVNNYHEPRWYGMQVRFNLGN